MTTVRTRADQIFAREGFSIIVKHKRTSRRVQLGRNGVLGPYPYDRKLKDSATVAEWRTRFETDYPSYTCDVLKADGVRATGQTLLETVCATY